MSEYRNECQQRLLRILEALISCEQPLRLVDIAAAVEVNSATVLRDLENLRLRQWAYREPDGTWRAGETWQAERERVESGVKKSIIQLLA